jgi:4'-phosphopantetheinyl transferase
MRHVVGLGGAIYQNLDDVERARAHRYVRSEDQVRFAATRSALRELLGAHINVIPGKLVFAATARGRPELPDYPSLSFNVSHSGDAALIAISDQRVVGVDVESLDSLSDWRELAALVCTEEERCEVQAAPESRQHELFMRCWVAKEALLKALGVGIGEGLLGLRVDPTREGVQQPIVKEGARLADACGLHFHWLSDIDGHPGCIAYGPARIHWAGDEPAGGSEQS